VNLLSRHLLPQGFKRSNFNWRRCLSEVIQVVNLQSAGYAGQYYINLGLFLREKKDSPRPKHYECQVRARLEDLTPDAPRALVEQALCLSDTNIKEKDRIDFLENVVSHSVVRFLESTTDEEQVKRVVLSRSFNIMSIDRQGSEYLGIK
jgi:hypothetical protein